MCGLLKKIGDLDGNYEHIIPSNGIPNASPIISPNITPLAWSTRTASAGVEVGAVEGSTWAAGGMSVASQARGISEMSRSEELREMSPEARRCPGARNFDGEDGDDATVAPPLASTNAIAASAEERAATIMMKTVGKREGIRRNNIMLQNFRQFLEIVIVVILHVYWTRMFESITTLMIFVQFLVGLGAIRESDLFRSLSLTLNSFNFVTDLNPLAFSSHQHRSRGTSI